MLSGLSPFVKGHPYNGAGEGLSFDESRMGGPEPQSGSISKPFLRINEALLSSVTGETKEGLSEVVNLNLHIRDTRYPKIREIASLHLVSNLRILNLSYNAIEHLDGLDFCSHLIELNVAENQIKSFRGLEKLSMLERLNLSGNDITRISSDISSLLNLVSLHLSRNKIHVLEDLLNLQPLQKLHKLRLQGNPIVDIFGEQEHRDYVALRVPQVRELDEVDLHSHKSKHRKQLHHDSDGHEKGEGGEKENLPNRSDRVKPASLGESNGGSIDSGYSSFNRVLKDVSVDGSLLEGDYHTPMASRPAAPSSVTARRHLNNDTSTSSIGFVPSPTRSYTVSSRRGLTSRSKSAVPMVTRGEIDDLGGMSVSVLRCFWFHNP